MKKKALFLSLSSVVLLSLAACGPAESNSDSANSVDSAIGQDGNFEGQTLVVWEDIDKSVGIEEAIAEFESEYGVTVEVTEKAYGGQLEDLRLDGPAGTGPDVFTIPGDQVGTAVVEGLLKEMTVEEDVQDLYTAVALESQMVDGKLYGLPKVVETTILYYNKDLISESEVPTNIEDWYELSKTATADGQYGLLALWDQIYYAQSVIGGYDGYIFAKDADGKYDTADIGLNTDGAIEAASYIQKWYEEGLFPSGMIGEQAINVLDSLFSEGKAAAVISGPWNLEPFSSAGIDYGVLPLPELPNGNPMSAFVGVKSYNVSSYSKNSELAELFIEFITNEENSLRRYETTKEVPAVKSLAEGDALADDPAAQAVAQQSLHSELTPNVPEMNEVWSPADAALQTIATGKATPKEALDQAVETIENQIEANHGGQ
nr:extracellular solute-binding protein [uncultured Trichococcus sp.]